MLVTNNKLVTDTDFIAAGGPNGYAWNVVHSEADEIMFKHAQSSGAKVFNGIKVNSVEFSQPDSDGKLSNSNNDGLPNPDLPVSATWTRKDDGTQGVIKFDYLVDASGHVGMVSTKYLKNHRYNQGLKNVASWAYWKNTGTYAVGQREEGCPYFKALQGE